MNVPPKALVEPCTIVVPPTFTELRDALTAFPDADNVEEARLLLLTEFGMEQTAAAGECHRQVLSIRSWAEQHLNWEVTP